MEEYTPKRKAEFLLNNAVDEDDYQEARQEVIKMGLNPEKILHNLVMKDMADGRYHEDTEKHIAEVFS